MNRTRLVVICIAGWFAALQAFAQQDTTAATQGTVIDEIAWVVGDEAIFRSDIEQFLLDMRVSQERSMGANAKCEAAEELALQKLFLHQAELDSIVAGDDYVAAMTNDRYDTYVQNYGSVERMEAMYGKSSSQIKENIRTYVRNSILMERVRESVAGKIKVTPADVRTFLRETPEDSLPDMPITVEVQILVREPEIPQSEIDRIKDALREYTERVNSGSPFSSLAILYSEDSGSARRGGETGLTAKGVLDPAFAAVAFSLTDPKKVSKIVQSEFGFHIMQLIEKRGDRVNVRHILRTPKASEEAIKDEMQKLDSLANDIRRGKLTFEKAATELSQDKDTYQNNGLMQNEETQTARYEMDNLPPEVAAAISTMNVNEVSQPFRMRNKQGKEVCAIVKLRNRIPAHRINIADDFQMLQNEVLSRRRNEAMRKWIQDKQKTTFVHISENWEQCTLKYPDWQLR